MLKMHLCSIFVEGDLDTWRENRFYLSKLQLMIFEKKKKTIVVFVIVNKRNKTKEKKIIQWLSAADLCLF